MGEQTGLNSRLLQLTSDFQTTTLVRHGCIAAIMVRSKKSNAYGDREVNFLEQVAAQIAGPLKIAGALDQLEQSA